jgi:uncharacterized protein (UPF0332 family)
VHDVTAESHAAVKRMFGLYLICAGESAPEWPVHLGESQDDRLAVDYDAEASFSREDARHECRRTQELLRRIRQYLLAKGLTAYELRR